MRQKRAAVFATNKHRDKAIVSNRKVDLLEWPLIAYCPDLRRLTEIWHDFFSIFTQTLRRWDREHTSCMEETIEETKIFNEIDREKSFSALRYSRRCVILGVALFSALNRVGDALFSLLEYTYTPREVASKVLQVFLPLQTTSFFLKRLFRREFVQPTDSVSSWGASEE